MSARRARTSTLQQRRYYDRLRRSRTASPHPTATQRRILTNTAMASNQNGSLPVGDEPRQVPVTEKQNGGHQATPDVPVVPPTSGQDGDNNATPGQDESDQQVGTRLKNIEEILVEWKRDKEAQAAAQRRSRPRSPSPASRSNQGPTRRQYHATRTHSAARHSRRSPRRSSRTRSRTRSRSTRRTRSKSRHSSSRRRHTRSRSRSKSRDSRSRRTRSRSRSRSRSRRRQRSTSRHSRRRTPDDNDLHRALESQYPSMGKPKGKKFPTHRLTLEPYKKLPPDLKRKAGDRRSRKDLLFPEHMCGLLSMILDTVDEGSELYGALEHATQVAEDAASLNWPDVREWSQACLSFVEGGKTTWADRSQFEKSRTRLSWVKGKSRDPTKIPCHDHNTSKCPEKETHNSEGKIWLHTCSICYYAIGDEDTTHISRRCKGKSSVKSYRDDARRDNNRWRQNQQGRKDGKQAANNPPKN